MLVPILLKSPSLDTRETELLQEVEEKNVHLNEMSLICDQGMPFKAWPIFLPTTALKVTKKPAELHYSFPMKQKNNYGHQQQQPKKSSSTCIRMDKIEKPTPQKGHTLSSKEAWGEGGLAGWSTFAIGKNSVIWCSEGIESIKAPRLR